jgi:hypothetical protein
METLYDRADPRNRNRACEYCGAVLPPSARRHARFCSPAHRRAAHRAHNPDPRRARARFLSCLALDKAAVPYAYVGIVSDKRWLGMYRLKRRDGRLSDMVNLTRARDALRAAQEGRP